jgi:hypothetical protein
MNRKALLLVLWLIAALGWMAVAQSIPKIGSQSVLINLPKTFHSEELVQMLQQFVDAEADIYVSSVHTLSATDVAALTARIPARFFNLQPGLSGGPRVTVIPASEQFERHFDKALFLGGGWYDEYFEPSGYTQSTQPAYAEDLYGVLDRTLSDGGVVCSIGAGLYPLVCSGLLEPGTEVPFYDCIDAIETVEQFGYLPVVMETTPRSDGSWPPFVEIEIHVADALNGTAVMSPIPNSWYPLTDEFGLKLLGDYLGPYQDTFDAVETAYSQPVTGLDVTILSMRCGENSVLMLRNNTMKPIDMSGWKLQTVNPDTQMVLAEHTFTSLVLQPGEEMQVYVGAAPEAATENQVWPLNNAFGMPGDTGMAVLVNSQGRRESTYVCEVPYP